MNPVFFKLSRTVLLAATQQTVRRGLTGAIAMGSEGMAGLTFWGGKHLTSALFCANKNNSLSSQSL